MATVARGRIARPGLARRLADALEAGSVLLVAGPGYGKTMAVEEALELANRQSLWVACGQVGGDAGRLLIAVVEGLRRAVPGLADVVGDRFAGGVGPVDVGTAATALVADLELLLVEPLVIVFDDAEELEDAPDALALVNRLLVVRGAPLALAIATRRPLELRLAKLRAGGTLAEIGPAELSLSAGECAELLSLRHGRPATDDEVEGVLEASEGWPMGVALTGLAEAGRTRAAGAHSRTELFNYLAEEVLERLDPPLRTALLDSSVPAMLTPELAGDLGLPPDFLPEAERSGLFLREYAPGEWSYHPLFRSFLRERLRELRPEAERAELHARAAAGLAAAGRAADAIEHWLEAGRFEEALSLLLSDGAALVRTAPETVGSWLEAVPGELREEPDYLFLEAQLLWGAGQHERALEPLRAAVSGYRAAGDTDREWIARVFLADSLVFVGAFAEVSKAAEGWDAISGPVAGMAARAVAWYLVLALSARGRIGQAEGIRKRLRRDGDGGAEYSFLDVVTYAGGAPGAGLAERALERLHSTIAELEHDDPFGRLPYALNMVVLILRDLGERDAALEWLDRCEPESERVGLGFLARDCRLQRASLLAQRGELSRAERELDRAGKLSGTGWRGVHQAEAEAHVAILRGDVVGAAAEARRALEIVEPGPLAWRVRAAVEMTPVLAEAGMPDVARAAIAATMPALDERYPGTRGRLHRARLLAARAWLEHEAGEVDRASASMCRSWAEAGAAVNQVVRAHWPAIQPVLWRTLSERAIAPEAALSALQEAFPGGEALAAMVDHPDPAVRRPALLAGLAAGHPVVLDRLATLAGDPDGQVAAAAATTLARVRERPPPLRFELLGGFRVGRAGWEIDEAAWQRPMAARIVRFLLIQGSSGVPEDVLFEAFWADRPADAARQHLAVAVSRARKVLDLPGVEQSVIDARERTYWLRLRERDSVDADEFERTAAAALAERGGDRRAALEDAAALWTGEPLPEDRYAEWSFAWRERLVHAYSEVLGALAEAYDVSGEHHEAIRVARRLLELDPLNERAHQRLIVAYARTGRKSQALRQFLECRRALVTDLGVEPSAETSRLQARVLAGEPV